MKITVSTLIIAQCHACIDFKVQDHSVINRTCVCVGGGGGGGKLALTSVANKNAFSHAMVKYFITGLLSSSSR